MNRRLAAAGVLLVFVAVAVGSGAFTVGDEVTSPDAQGSVFFAPSDSPTGDAYAEFNEDDEITITVDRLNADAETLIDDLFDVGYEGEQSAEVWVEHDSASVTFYDETGSPIENEEDGDRIVLGSGEVGSIGISVDTRENVERLEEVTLVALLPTDDSLIVDPPPGGGGGVVQPEPDTDADTEPGPGVDRSRLFVDLGPMNVQFRQPDFEYTAEVPERDVNVLSPGLAGALLTAVDDDAPAPEETVVVESTVENTGNRGGTTAANLMVNGRVIETRDVELGPGESKELSFVVGFDESGQYEVAVGNAEPVTVFVTAIGFNWIPWAVAAAIISLISISLIYRRWKENKEAAVEGEDGG